jgi:SAM-dependent methyltransferase
MDLITEDTRFAVGAYRHAGAAGHATVFDERYWEDLYRTRTAIWSGNPNPQLVAEAADLTPGAALDVGSGEGGDALWLAGRGWRVTAVDISTTALERGAARAAAEDITGIEWTHADVTVWTPPAEQFHLVSAQFMHPLQEERDELFGRLSAAVAPGGTLLIVGHNPSELHQAPAPGMHFTAEQVAASLDPARWEILVAEDRTRSARGHDGHEITVGDAVIRARRRR